MNIKLLRKTEEMILYMINQSKTIKLQNDQIQLQNKEIHALTKR